jgi:hypothetical protein
LINSRKKPKTYKKYPSLKKELADLASILSNNSTTGTSLGNNTFKIRISIKSKTAEKVVGPG